MMLVAGLIITLTISMFFGSGVGLSVYFIYRHDLEDAAILAVRCGTILAAVIAILIALMALAVWWFA